MRRRPPRAIRKTGHDLRSEAARFRDQGDRLLDTMRLGREVWSVHPPLAIVTGASLDASVMNATPRVDVLAADELTAAAERANIDLAAATSADDLALQGFVSALRGTAGELHALELLSEGRLPAPEGSASTELIAHEYPGVDLVFRDQTGRLIDTANVKIATSPDIALRHFGRHPDVRLVYAPTDTAERLAEMDIELVRPDGIIPAEGRVVIDLGAPTETFDLQVREALAGTVVDTSTPLWQLVPWFGIGAVGIRAARRLSSGADPSAVRQLAIGDAAVTTVASTTAKAAALATGSTLGAIPFAVVGAWAAQAAVATRQTWRQAAAQEQQLRTRLLALPPRR
jgi:hypothetical protein